MAILRSSHKAGKTKHQPKSFKKLISRLGQRSQLAAPKYANSTKLMTESVWGRWTQYVSPLRFIAFFFLGRRLTTLGLDSVATSPTTSQVPILSTSIRTIYITKL